MVQKRSCSTKGNRIFYDMVNIRAMITQNFNTLTKYKTLFENVITILPITYQNKTEVSQKNRNTLVYLL